MYRCQLCGSVPRSTPAFRKIVETRSREYPLRLKANSFRRKRKEKHSDDPGGTGHEIARELLVCPTCAAEPSAEGHVDGRLRGPPVLAAA